VDINVKQGKPRNDNVKVKKSKVQSAPMNVHT
jgi:hypothetical protein